ncbi:hypothetical protein Q5P01_000715 [Channa striata]|uniref:Uncharacterized protein n=1 Tax=Channa striata TaxID=64152 RepID=A0AA88IHA1_CHASR|nr:hypothetical protein Q5P01_000715 [Channa striata]
MGPALQRHPFSGLVDSAGLNTWETEPRALRAAKPTPPGGGGEVRAVQETLNPPASPGERASWVPGRGGRPGKPAAATLGLGFEGRAGPWRTGHDPRHPPRDAPPGVKSVSPRAGAGRAVCARGKRRGAGRPAWAQPRTKEEEGACRARKGNRTEGRPPGRRPREAGAGATDAGGARPEAQATEAGGGAFAGEKGRGASPTPSAPVGFDKACRRQGLPR